MAGLFAKGGGGTTPGQQAVTSSSKEQIANYLNTWLPVQSYFAGQNEGQKNFNAAQMRGQAASAANASGAKGMAGLTQAYGGNMGSGGAVTRLGMVNNATAGTKAAGLTTADAAARRDYVRGLQTSLGLLQKDQNLALGGMKTAAATQAQEAGLTQAQDAQSQQGAAQLIGIAAAL